MYSMLLRMEGMKSIMNQVFRYLLLMLSSLEFLSLQSVGDFIPLFTITKFKQKSATKKTSVKPNMM